MSCIKFLISLLTVMTLLGCKRPQADPQNGDYIYQQIREELGAEEAKLNERREQYQEFLTNLKDPDIPSAKRKILQVKADRASQDVRKLEQRLKYWKLKLLSREEQVRNSYLDAFNNGSEWDNSSEETERFKKAQKRLHRTATGQIKSNSDSKTKSQSHSEKQTESKAAEAGEH